MATFTIFAATVKTIILWYRK